MVTKQKIRLSVIWMHMSKLLLSQNLVFDFCWEDIARLSCLGEIYFCVSYNAVQQIKMLCGLMGKPRFQNSLLYVPSVCVGNQGETIKPSLIVRAHSTESTKEKEFLTWEHQSLGCQTLDICQKPIHLALLFIKGRVWPSLNGLCKCFLLRFESVIPSVFYVKLIFWTQHMNSFQLVLLRRIFSKYIMERPKANRLTLDCLYQ